MKIKFSHNWNEKLSQPVFTTIRCSTKEKLAYYRNCLQKSFDVELNGKVVGKAILRDVFLRQLGDLNYSLLVLDTGSFKPYAIFSKFGLKNLTDLCIVLIFEKEENQEKSEGES